MIDLVETQPMHHWVRPILLTACAADGSDVVQVDARRWFERAAREMPYAIRELCSCWFTAGSEDPAAATVAEILRTLDTDTSLFLVRMELSKTSWTCNIDRAAVTKWISDTQPDLLGFVDPLMIAG
jgi:hypothetical protein